MVETYRIKITQDAISVLLTSDGTEVRFKDEPIEALKDILGLVDFAPNSMVSQRLLECKGQSFDLPNGYTAQVRTDCGCSNLKGPSKECQEAGGKNPYKCVHEDLKVAVLIPLKQEPTILIHDSKNPEGRPMTKNEQLKFNGRDEYMSIGTKPNEYVSFGSIPKGEVKSYIVKEPQYHFERWVDGDRVFYSNGHTTSEHALADDPVYGDGYIILDRDTQKLFIFKDGKLVESGEPGNEAKKESWISVKDKLPENDTWVIAYSKSAFRYSGQMVVLYSDETFYGYGMPLAKSEVTHWQPTLPEPTH